ncbi:hypothetical protein FKM82_004193 [Ascaphus truei]
MLQLHSHIHRVAVASVTSSARAHAPARLACPCTHLPACTRALPSGYVPCTLHRSILRSSEPPRFPAASWGSTAALLRCCGLRAPPLAAIAAPPSAVAGCRVLYRSVLALMRRFPPPNRGTPDSKGSPTCPPQGAPRSFRGERLRPWFSAQSAVGEPCLKNNKSYT